MKEGVKVNNRLLVGRWSCLCRQGVVFWKEFKSMFGVYACVDDME